MPSGISEEELAAAFLGDKVSKPMHVEEPVPAKPKTATACCMHCEKEFTFLIKRGSRPQLCSDECKVANRNLKKKPKEKIVRKHKCKTCSNQIVQTGKGGTRVYCGVCREERRKKSYKKYREKNKVTVERDQGKCLMCDKSLGVLKGRGRVRKYCPECYRKKRNEKSREYEKRKYKPVVRTYSCGTCRQTFTQTGKGKLRKYCKGCS
tara:strand:+ start:244 stop:864 length:621 start_codon:yes stop_codon:yes gene_type:complete